MPTHKKLIDNIRDYWPMIVMAFILTGHMFVSYYRLNQLESRTGWMKSQQEAINKIREDIARIDERTRTR